MTLVLTIGTLVCATLYLALAGLAGFGKTRAPHVTWLVTACLTTSLWAFLQWQRADVPSPLYSEGLIAIEVLRNLAWVGFLAALYGISRDGVDGWLKGLLGLAILLPVAGVLGGFVMAFSKTIWIDPELLTMTTGAGLMLLCVTGLLILENLYRNAGHDQRWGTLYLCIGVALFFIYDFFFYAESLLFKRLDGQLAEARSFVTAIGAPLIAIALSRVRYWSVDLQLSRQMVFHTAALVGAGTYLVLMSVAAWAIGRYSGEAATVFQITFLALALVLMVAIFSSGSLRSRLRLFIARHFYSSKYDYRDEWLRFITTLGSADESSSIEQRIVWSVAPIVDSTAAALWVKDRDLEVLRPVVSWNYGDHLQTLALGDPLVRKLEETSGVIVYDTGEEGPSPAVKLPDWIEQERKTWLILPLHYRQRLQGVLLLGEPRAPRGFDAEDHNLLTTVASQAASYLAEDRAADALAQARKMEEFNTRFTFVAHDLKNVVNQLSILVRNAEKHGDNPAFQKDMVATVANSVERMKGLMEDLKSRSEAVPQSQRLETLQIPMFDLPLFLKGFVEDWRAQGAKVSLECDVPQLPIAAKEDVLASALNHILQNALDAAGPSEPIQMSLSRSGTDLVLDVADQGPGMEPEFIEAVYFKPFGTTKPGGYGIGGFQIRQHVRDLGAKLEVLSTPGRGTTVRIRFDGLAPAGDATPEARSQEETKTP